MKQIISISLPLALLFLIVGCSQDQISSDGYKKFENEEISFEYPADWEKQDLSALNMDTSTIKAAFISISTRNNVNLDIQEHAVLAPSAEYTANLTVDQLELFGEAWGMSDFKKIKYEDRDYNGLKAGILYGEYKISQTGQNVFCAAFIVPFGNKTYTLSYTSFTAHELDEIVDESKRIFDSFHIKAIR